jgi:hypothetical protein
VGVCKRYDSMRVRGMADEERLKVDSQKLKVKSRDEN